ncbi:hypothetical protein [Sorangium sp. So ce233]|uniref:hypothetical protein n=1 Tax=Sorangium sp. So ce233 TaxID=3133290 RepID=UPI003F5EA7C8
MNASIALHLPGHSAFEAAVLAAAKLCGVVWRGPESLVEARRRETIAALERLSEACGEPPWLRWRLASLLDEETWRADWTEESGELIQALGELLALDEAMDAPPALAAAPAAPESRPASPPPPSGDGDEEAAELSAALAATGDTVPPASGERELGEMACAAADTDAPEPGSVEWWDDQPTVRS